jgi:glycosyltransferase EpsF
MNVHRNLDRSKIQFDYVSHLHGTCDYDDEITSLGGNVIRIRSLGQLGLRAYLNELRRIMLHTSYAAVHAHTDYQSGIAALAAKRAGIHIRICHSHSSNWKKGNGLKANMTLRALRAIIKYSATDFCACSPAAGRFLFGDVCTHRNKVKLLKNGIDLNEFTQLEDSNYSVRQELNIAPETRIIGHIGRFSESKNQSFILRILKKMLQEDQNVAAVLVGDGPLKHEIEEEAKRLKIYNHIRFLGVRKDIPRLMRAFDVFIFPSLFEGFGIVTLEAQATGTPCIASDTIPKDTDLGLGLMSFISLDDKLDIWTKEIDKAFFVQRPEEKQILSHFLRSRYDIKHNMEEWMALYGIE